MSEPRTKIGRADLPVWLIGCGGIVLCFMAVSEKEWIAGSVFLLAAAVAFGALLVAVTR